MWIAIVYEKSTTVIEWNLVATRDAAIRWVIDSSREDCESMPNEQALQLIEAAGYVIQIEEVGHLATTVEYGVRFPNGLIRNCRDDDVAAYDLQQKGDETLRKAYSPERCVVVEASVLRLDWSEVV